jgi:hypothetical protein
MATKYWTGKADLYEFDYDNGAHAPVVGETINVDVAAGETAVVQAWTVAAGAWATNDASGKMWVYSCSATFITNLVNNDNIDDADDNQICITTGGVTARTSGDWQLPGNWGTGEDPAVPLDADTVVFDGRSTLCPTEGMLDTESGHNLQGAHPLVHFKSSWAQGVASAAEPLIFAPDKLIIDGEGTYYICCGEDDQSSDVDIGDTYINNADATVYLYSYANDGVNICEWAAVLITAGTLYLAYLDSTVVTDAGTDAGCWVDSLYISPVNNQKSKVTVYVQKDAIDQTGPDEMHIWMRHGTVYCDSELGTVRMQDGDFYYGTDLGASPETGLDIEQLWQHGGKFYWQPDDTDSAVIEQAKIFAGTFDASGTTNNDRAKVLGGGASKDIYIYPGATMNLANGAGNITLAANSKIFNFGGTFTVDSNTSISLDYDT